MVNVSGRTADARFIKRFGYNTESLRTQYRDRPAVIILLNICGTDAD